MTSDAAPFGWRWVLIAVAEGGEVTALDPEHARHGREVRLGPEAVIDNLLVWLDRP